jgi:hypothetical protein
VSVTTALAANDIVKLCTLPARCVPVDFYITSTDLDTAGSPAITLSASVLSADGTDLAASTEFFVSSTVGQAGGVARADKANGLRLAPSLTDDRVVGLKVVVAAGTPAAGTITGVLLYRASNFD